MLFITFVTAFVLSIYLENVAIKLSLMSADFLQLLCSKKVQKCQGSIQPLKLEKKEQFSEVFNFCGARLTKFCSNNILPNKFCRRQAVNW
jgi:hypothetical protein